MPPSPPGRVESNAAPVALLLLLAVGQFYVGALEPFFVDLGFPGGPFRILRHSYLVPVGLAFLLALALPRSDANLTPAMRTWVRLMVAALAAMALHGFVRGGEPRRLVLELGSYVVFVTAVVVGSQRAWRTRVDRAILFSFLVGIVIISTELQSATIETREDAIVSSAYRVSHTLMPWCFALMTWGLRGRLLKFGTAGALVAFAYALVVFQKRAPLVGLAIAVSLWLLILPLPAGVRGIARRYALVAGAVGVVLATAYAGRGAIDEDLLTKSMEGLSHRFDDATATAAASGSFITGNDRWVEAGWILSDLSPLEVLFGRGLGGAVEVPWWWHPGNMMSFDGRTFWGLSECHVGLFLPVLKGGIAFWALFYFAWFHALGGYRRLRRHGLALACWGTLLLVLGFMTIESYTGSQAILSMFVLGYCVGVAGSRDVREPHAAPAFAASPAEVARGPVAAGGLGPSLARSRGLPILLVLLAGSFASPLPARAGPPEWPLPAADGSFTRSVSTDGLPTHPSVVWKKRAGGGFSEVVVQDLDGDGAAEVVQLVAGRAIARRPSTGAILWASPSLALGYLMPGFDGRVHDLTGDGVADVVAVRTTLLTDTRIHLLDGATGEVRWTFGEGLGPNSGTNGGNFGRIAQIDADPALELVVFVTANDQGPTLYAFDFSAGFGPEALQWKAPGITWFGGSSFVVVDVGGDGLPEVAHLSARDLFVFSGTDGALVAKTKDFYGPGGPSAAGYPLQAVEVDGDPTPELAVVVPAKPGLAAVVDLDPATGGASLLLRLDFDVPSKAAPVADLDGDDRMEVAVSTLEEGTWVTRVHEGASGLVLGEAKGRVVSPILAGAGGAAGLDLLVREVEGETLPDLAPVHALRLGEGGLEAVWPAPLDAGLPAAWGDVDGDGEGEIAAYRDLDGDGKRDALQLVQSTPAGPEPQATLPFPKGLEMRWVTSAPGLPAAGARGVVAFTDDGFLDVLDPALLPAGTRLATGGFAPRLLAAATEPAGPVRVLVADSVGRVLSLDGGAGGPTEPPPQSFAFGGVARSRALAVLDVDGDGPREVFAHQAVNGVHTWALFESDLTTPRWTWTPSDATGGVDSFGAGAGGDLDGDGVLDFVALTFLGGERVDVPLSGATGAPLGWTWTPWQGSSGAGTAYAPALLRDLDGDGLADVLVSHYNDRLLGDAGGPEDPPAAIHAFRGLDGAVLAATNDVYTPAFPVALDGESPPLDLAVTWWTGRGALRLDGGGFQALWLEPVPGPISRAPPVVLDLDADGAVDLVHVSPSSGEVRASAAKTGAPLWSEDADAVPGLRKLAGGRVWKVLAAGGFEDATTGEVAAALPPGQLVETALGLAGAAGGGSLVVLSGWDGLLYALDGATGTLAWTLDLAATAGDLAAADLDGDGRAELLVSADDGFVRAIAEGVDLGLVPEVRDGAGPEDVDLALHAASGFGTDRFAATWDPPAAGLAEPEGFLVRLVTATGAVVADWQDVGAAGAASLSSPVPLVPGAVYRIVVAPWNGDGIGAAVASDGFSIADGDEDGLLDGDEADLGTDPGDPDTDGDGLGDALEAPGAAPVDTDVDGVLDALDTDSDGDGIEDEEEGLADRDGDGIPEYRDADDDGDGIDTAVEREDAIAFGADPDGDGLPSWHDPDADADLLDDGVEGRGDADGDGVPDYLDPDPPPAPEVARPGEPPSRTEPEDGALGDGPAPGSAAGGCGSEGCSGGSAPPDPSLLVLLFLILAATRRGRLEA